jgi:hypothetical protein
MRKSEASLRHRIDTFVVQAFSARRSVETIVWVAKDEFATSICAPDAALLLRHFGSNRFTTRAVHF